MRIALVIAALALLIGTCPGHAQGRQYPWCARTIASGYQPSCGFTSFRQCMATVSGQAGDCIQNPALAYGQLNSPRRGHDQRRQPMQDDYGPRGWDW